MEDGVTLNDDEIFFQSRTNKNIKVLGACTIVVEWNIFMNQVL